MKNEFPSDLEQPVNTEQPANQYCGLGRRLLAMMYDGVVLAGLLLIAGAIALPVSGEQRALQDIPYTVYLMSVSFVYLGWCWTHGGQTMGMRAWKLHLVRNSGGTITWTSSLIRFLVAIPSLAAGGLGYLYGLFSRNHRCLPDMASGTSLLRIQDSNRSS